MKFSLLSILATLTVATQQQCSAFVVNNRNSNSNICQSTSVTSNQGSLLIVHGTVELEPEPEGGEEVSPLKSLEDTKVKNMGEAEGANSDSGTPYNFWMTTVAKGALVKSLHGQVLRESKKQANFPGFRKVR